MLRRFGADKRGNFSIMMVVATVPILGGLALAVDYTEISRQRQATLNALDAAGIATARRIAEGADETQAKTYAQNFFDANLGPVDPDKATLAVVLPSSASGGGTLKLSADLEYQPYFLAAFRELLVGNVGDPTVNFSAKTEIRLKNTLEVALVLDNSGSMEKLGSGSGEMRIELLKDAAKDLVDTIANQAVHMKQVDKPVQFGLVPFAASVNVGKGYAGADWMDTKGESSVHHENFDWSTFTATDKKVQLVGGAYTKVGSAWGTEANKIVTRFSLYDELKRQDGTEWVKTGTETYCVRRRDNGTCREWGERDTGYNKPIYKAFASWEGCVEMRPAPYTFQASTPVSSDPDSYYVPWFAPDETDRTDSNGRPANNNWWNDDSTSTDSASRQRRMPKYFKPAADGTGAMSLDEGPNAGCTTKPITPLVDVSTETGLSKIKTAIDGMQPLGGTNVPQGVVWGWNVVSGAAPFTEGRGDQENGNDKVVIVLTDGENTYYTPTSVVAKPYSGTYASYGGNDLAGNKSLYSAYGYTGKGYDGGDTRLFRDTSSAVKKDGYDNANYSAALNEHMAKICGNAKAAGIVVMTVALDLSDKIDAQKKQIESLRACASESRFRKDAATGQPVKLFWNATGGDLDEKFEEIADELSNLRIVG